ncbi:MAG: hypothetical protein ACT4P5_11050, partial [Armatimonadota bacterium]
GGGWNFYHQKDPDIDRLLEQGETEVDAAKRKQVYESVQRRMMEQAFILPVVYQHQISAFKNTVVNAIMYPVLGEYPYFYDAYIRR